MVPHFLFRFLQLGLPHLNGDYCSVVVVVGIRSKPRNDVKFNAPPNPYVRALCMTNFFSKSIPAHVPSTMWKTRGLNNDGPRSGSHVAVIQVLGLSETIDFCIVSACSTRRRRRQLFVSIALCDIVRFACYSRHAALTSRQSMDTSRRCSLSEWSKMICFPFYARRDHLTLCVFIWKFKFRPL